MTYSVISRCWTVLVVNLFGTSEFKRKCDSFILSVKDFLLSVRRAAVDAAKNIMSKIEEEDCGRFIEVKESQLPTSGKRRSVSSERSKFGRFSELL